MSFDLHAVISSSATADAIKRRWDQAVVVPLAQGLSLIPISRALLVQLETGRSRSGKEQRTLKEFEDLTPGVLEVLTDASHSSAVAYVEADDFGDVGGQIAAVWSAGKLAFGPKVLAPGEAWPPGGGPIDEALHLLGAVVDRPNADEFMCVGLGRFRHTQQWVDLPGLAERLPTMDLTWIKRHDWADFHTTVSDYTFGLKVSDVPGISRYSLMAAGTGTLMTLARLPSGWQLSPKPPEPSAHEGELPR